MWFQVKVIRAAVTPVALCLCLAGAITATAEEQNWKTVHSSAFGGYVLSYDQSTDWKEQRESFSGRNFPFKEGKTGEWLPLKNRSISSDFFKMKRLNKRLNFTPGKYTGWASFSIKQHDLPGPVTTERWFNVNKKSWKDYGIIVYGEGTMQVLGKKAFYYLSSGKTKWGQKKVPATGSTRKTIFVAVNDRVLLEIEFYTTYTEQFAALRPIFERILKSIKVTPVAELDPAQISHPYVTPEITISRRRGYYLDISIAMVLPPSWSVIEPIIKPASDAKPRGWMIVEFRRKKDQNRLTFLLVVEGMPTGKPLGPADYLATTDILIDKLMSRHGSGKAVKVKVPLSMFCMGHMKNRLATGTGKKAHVRSYSGKNSKGRDVRALVYTAGGYTAACNLIFLAQTKDFDKALPDFEAIVKSIDSREYSPSFLGRR